MSWGSVMSVEKFGLNKLFLKERKKIDNPRRQGSEGWDGSFSSRTPSRLRGTRVFAGASAWTIVCGGVHSHSASPGGAAAAAAMAAAATEAAAAAVAAVAAAAVAILFFTVLPP